MAPRTRAAAKGGGTLEPKWLRTVGLLSSPLQFYSGFVNTASGVRLHLRLKDPGDAYT